MFLINQNGDRDKKSSTLYQHLGTIIWYIIFVGFVPFIIKNERYLRIYFPMIDLIANVCSSAGKTENRIFKDLYKLTPNNITSFLSTNFINLIALFGVALNGAYYILKTQNKWLGIKVMLIMYLLTYLLPTQGLNWITRYIQNKINKLKYDKKDKSYLSYIKKLLIKYPIFFDYLGGFIIVILLVITESFIISTYLNYLDI